MIKEKSMQTELKKCPRCGTNSFDGEIRTDMTRIGSENAMGEIEWIPAPNLEGLCCECGFAQFAPSNQPIPTAQHIVMIGNRIFA